MDQAGGSSGWTNGTQADIAVISLLQHGQRPKVIVVYGVRHQPVWLCYFNIPYDISIAIRKHLIVRTTVCANMLTVNVILLSVLQASLLIGQASSCSYLIPATALLYMVVRPKHCVPSVLVAELCLDYIVSVMALECSSNAHSKACN